MLDYLKLLLECIPDGDFSPVRPLLADTFGTMTEPGEFIYLTVDRSPSEPRIKAWNDFSFLGGNKAWEEPEKEKDELIVVLTELLAPFRDERTRSLLQLVRLVGDRGVCKTPKSVLLSEFESHRQGIFYPEAKYALLRRPGPEETPGSIDSWILDLTLDKNDRIVFLKLTDPRYVFYTDLKNNDVKERERKSSGRSDCEDLCRNCIRRKYFERSGDCPNEEEIDYFNMFVTQAFYDGRDGKLLGPEGIAPCEKNAGRYTVFSPDLAVALCQNHLKHNTLWTRYRDRREEFSEYRDTFLPGSLRSVTVDLQTAADLIASLEKGEEYTVDPPLPECYPELLNCTVRRRLRFSDCRDFSEYVRRKYSVYQLRDNFWENVALEELLNDLDNPDIAQWFREERGKRRR